MNSLHNSLHNSFPHRLFFAGFVSGALFAIGLTTMTLIGSGLLGLIGWIITKTDYRFIDE